MTEIPGWLSTEIRRIALTAYTYIETGAKQIVISESTAINEYHKMIQRCEDVLNKLEKSSDQEN